MDNPFDHIFTDIRKDLNDKIEEELRSRLEAEGHAYYISTLNDRFPKIMSVIQDDWVNVYIDNNTPAGFRILAYKRCPEVKYDIDENKNIIKATMEIKFI